MPKRFQPDWAITGWHMPRYPNPLQWIEGRQAKLGALAAREQEWLECMEAMDQALRRKQTETEFIEERLSQHDHFVAL